MTATVTDLLALLDTDPSAGLHGTAALIRERAQAATPGPWHVSPPDAPDDMQGVIWAGQATVAEVTMPIPPEYGLDGLADRDHLAPCTPEFMLTLTAVFEDAADALDLVTPTGEAVLTAARTYLGQAT